MCLTVDLSVETLQARREWQDIFKVLKGKNLHPRLLYPARISFTVSGEIKSVSNKQMLREFSITKPLLQQMFSSVQLSHSVVSNSLWPHESQHARPPCPSPTPGVHSDSRPSSRWCRPAISFSVVPFSSCPSSLPASESFPVSQLFTWGGQSTGVSALASFLPKNIQDWTPLEWTGGISLQSKGLSRVFFNNTVQKHQFFSAQLCYSPTLTSLHDYWKKLSFD